MAKVAESGVWFDPRMQDPMRQAIGQALSSSSARVERISTDQGAVWLKRVEDLNWRWRLQKGDPKRALARERLGLQLLRDKGLPVAALVAEGDDFLATLDGGAMLWDAVSRGDRVGRVRAFASAGQGLAAFHRAGVVHGRPKIRDIVWDGTTARFIDFERFDPRRTKPRAQAIDMLVLLHSILVEGEAGIEFDAVLKGWLSEAPSETVAAFDSLAGFVSRLSALAGLALRLKPSSREVIAIRRLEAALRARSRS